MAVKIFVERRTNITFSNTSSSLAKIYNNNHDSLGKFSHYIFLELKSVLLTDTLLFVTYLKKVNVHGNFNIPCGFLAHLLTHL